MLSALKENSLYTVANVTVTAKSMKGPTGWLTACGASELKKVTFPPRDEVISTTIVVIITSVIFAFYLWLADIVIIKLYEGIIRVLG